MTSTPLARLRARVARLGMPLCLGIDPHPDQLPAAFARDAHGVEAFACGLLDAVAEHVVAVKLNVAFFEALGAAGWAALERVRAHVAPDLYCILDAKRGDIGSTAERYAAGLFGHLAADAVTLSPYLGEDAIEPFLAYPDRVVYLLCRTSNPSAERFQAQEIDGRALFERVALWATDRWQGERAERVGLVVGATVPGELARLRGMAPDPAFLVPGVGAQGGDLQAAVRHCHGLAAPGVVSVSRAITAASSGPDWQEAAAAAAASWGARMRTVGATLPA